MPSPLKLYAMTLNDFLIHDDETIRRNAMSILKRLQKLSTEITREMVESFTITAQCPNCYAYCDGTGNMCACQYCHQEKDTCGICGKKKPQWTYYYGRKKPKKVCNECEQSKKFIDH